MVALRDLINDLGGGRTLTLGGLLLVFVYLAADRYLDTVEARFSAMAERIEALENRQHSDDVIHGSGARISAADGAAIGQRLDRIEARMDRIHGQ